MIFDICDYKFTRNEQTETLKYTIKLFRLHTPFQLFSKLIYFIKTPLLNNLKKYYQPFSNVFSMFKRKVTAQVLNSDEGKNIQS